MADGNKKCSEETLDVFGYLDKEKTQELENAIVQIIEGHKEVPVENLRKEIMDIVKLETKKMRELSMVKLGDEIKRNKIKNDIQTGFDKKIESVKDAKSYVKHVTKKLMQGLEGKNSIDTTYRSTENDFQRGLYGSLKKKGVFDEHRSGELDALVYEQNHRTANKKASIVDDVPEGFTKEQAKIAMEIEARIRQSNNYTLDTQRSAGIPIAERRDWLVKQNYSKTKMTSLGPKGYAQKMLDHAKLDELLPESILKSPEKTQSTLEDLYTAIMAGKDIYKGGDVPAGFASKLKSRQIEFKSGIDRHKFFQAVSDHQNLAESVDISLSQAAKAYSMAKTYGVHSEQNFNSVLADLENNFKKQIQGKFTPKESNKLIKDFHIRTQKAVDAYKVVSANNFMPSGALSNIVNVLRALHSMTKLGGSLFTSMFDSITISQQYALATGENQFKAFGQAIVDSWSFMKDPALRKEAVELLNTSIYIHDPALAMGGNRGDFKTGMDMFNRFVTNVYRMTGVPFQTEWSRNLGAMLQSRAIKKFVSDFKSGKMNELQKIKMERYGLNESDIDLLSTIKREEGLPDIISPQQVFDIDLAKFHSDPKVAFKLRRDLFDKVANWVDDAVQAGTPTPTARTKRILMKGENIDNEMVRAVMNLTMQFKETAAKIVDENIQAWNDVGQAHGWKGQTQGLGLYALNGMITYMLVQNARAYITGGKSPMEMYKKDGGLALFKDYVNKSSFLPVVTDFAGGASDKYWRTNVPNTIFGPTYAMGMDALQAIHKPSRKNIGKVGKHLMPLQNHFGVKFLERQMLGIDLWTGQKIRK